MTSAGAMSLARKEWHLVGQILNRTGQTQFMEKESCDRRTENSCCMRNIRDK